jgi:hypothetical protein
MKMASRSLVGAPEAEQRPALDAAMPIQFTFYGQWWRGDS